MGGGIVTAEPTTPPADSGKLCVDAQSSTEAERERPEYVDQVLAGRAVTTADMLAGLITAGTLEAAGQPDRLPHLMWPMVDPEVVREIWDKGAAVGYSAGVARSRSRWDTTDLHHAQALLAAAGYERMAGMVRRATSVAPSCRPADPGGGT